MEKKPSNARTVYATQETWQRWKDAAWHARLSVSELIRRAVEAYAAHDSGSVAKVTAALQHDGSVVGAAQGVSAPGAACLSTGQMIYYEVDGQQRVRLGDGSEHLLRPQPFTKERQTGKKR